MIVLRDTSCPSWFTNLGCFRSISLPERWQRHIPGGSLNWRHRKYKSVSYGNYRFGKAVEIQATAQTAR